MKYLKPETPASKAGLEHEQAVDETTGQSLDSAVFDSMKSMMEDEFVDLIDAFYLSCNEVFATMDGWDEWHANDDYRRQPHSLKSIAGNIGAMRMKELAALCETQIKDNALDEAKATYASIREEYQAVKHQLESLGYAQQDPQDNARAASH